MFPYKKQTPISLIVECEDKDSCVEIYESTDIERRDIVRALDRELLSLIAMLTNIAVAKGLLPDKTEAPSPVRE